MKPLNSVRRYMFVGILIILVTSSVTAQSTAFTFQGSLNDGGVPANGIYDFEFRLFDQASGGTELGAVQPFSGISLTDGRFSMTLDFGSEFPGTARWVEVRVRAGSGPAATDGLGGFTILTPRQPINSSPYSLKSLSTDSAATADFATLSGSAATADFATNAGTASTANTSTSATTARRSSSARATPTG